MAQTLVFAGSRPFSTLFTNMTYSAFVLTIFAALLFITALALIWSGQQIGHSAKKWERWKRKFEHSGLNLEVEEPPPPGCLLVMIQLLLVAPLSTLVIWCLLTLLAQAVRLDHLFNPPPALQEAAEEIENAAFLAASAITAGFLAARLAVSLRSTGRWLFLAGLLWLFLAPSLHEFSQYDSRATPLLTFVQWITDADFFPLYAYCGYSLGMLIWTVFRARD